MTTRKVIRDAIGTAIAAPGLTVFTGQHVAWSVDVMPAVYVNFASGAYEHDLVNAAMAKGEVTLAFAAAGGQDAVDLVADVAIDALLTDAAFIALVQSAKVQSFNYEVDPDTNISFLTVDVPVEYKP
jgi:hypothetical protein